MFTQRWRAPGKNQNQIKKISNKNLAKFIAACHEAAARGLMRCSSGNMSWRVDGKHMLATTTRSWMSRLTPDDVALCAIANGTVLNGKRPTVEISFHAGILRSRPDINVVLHFQTPFATALACRRKHVVNFFMIPEIPFYIGPVAQTPYFIPGSKALAKAVIKAMQHNDLVIMGNHGQVTGAGDFDHAIQNAEFFELACGIIVRNGEAARALPEKDVNDLLALRRDVLRPAAGTQEKKNV